MKRLVFLTGRSGIGKTTVLLNTANGLRDEGYAVGGMLSREVRKEGTRIGFEIVDFNSSQRGWLAHVDQPIGPQVSKYRVNLRDINQIGVQAIKKALESSEVIVVDEIGPMELFSLDFNQIVKNIVESEKLVIGVIHHKTQHPIINTIKKRRDTEIFEVTIENRSTLHNALIIYAIQFLKQRNKQVESSCA